MNVPLQITFVRPFLAILFAIYVSIFHKTEVLMVILRCLTGLNLEKVMASDVAWGPMQVRQTPCVDLELINPRHIYFFKVEKNVFSDLNIYMCTCFFENIVTNHGLAFF